MKLPWFRRVGLFFVPVAFGGWIILLAGLTLAFFRFSAIDRRSHSASDTLINFFFQLFIIGAVYSLVAYATSRISKTKP